MSSVSLQTRPKRLDLAAFALAVLAFAPVLAAGDAAARPRYRADHVWEREPELLGYRVSVEPILRYYKCGRGERCPGGDLVATDVVIWKIRTILRGPNGQEIEARFMERGRDSFVRDREVRVSRWWNRGDVPAQTRILRDYETAYRAFADWSRSDDPRTLDTRLDDVQPGPDHRPPPIDDDYDRPGRPDGPGRPDYRPDAPAGRPDTFGRCAQTIIDKGYGPTLVSNCQGADEYCAVKLLEKGYHPSQLSNCSNVEPTCALKLLDKGYHPNQLSSCQRDLSPGCADLLLDKGYHPTQLNHCARVDDRCAIAVLEKGHHPSQLSGCRR